MLGWLGKAGPWRSPGMHGPTFQRKTLLGLRNEGYGQEHLLLHGTGVIGILRRLCSEQTSSQSMHGPNYWCRSSAAEAPSPDCVIKGNINRKGERIYFRPGQLDYARVNKAVSAIDRFREQVTSCGQVSSSDAIPLAKFARDTRLRHPAHEGGRRNIFKLALDCGVWISYALHIRECVNKTR